MEVKYNKKDEPGARYFGEIEGIDEEEFANELQVLFSDKKTWDEGPDADEEQDDDIQVRMGATFEKVRGLFKSSRV